MKSEIKKKERSRLPSRPREGAAAAEAEGVIDFHGGLGNQCNKCLKASNGTLLISMILLAQKRTTGQVLGSRSWYLIVTFLTPRYKKRGSSEGGGGERSAALFGSIPFVIYVLARINMCIYTYAHTDVYICTHEHT